MQSKNYSTCTNSITGAANKMLLRNFRKVITTAALSTLPLVVFGTMHANPTNNSMVGMQTKTHHNMSVIQCQVHCTTAIMSKTTGIHTDRQDKEPTAYIPFTLTIVLSLLALSFVVKYLHLLASWRPPDKVLLCGRYADGL